VTYRSPASTAAIIRGIHLLKVRVHRVAADSRELRLHPNVTAKKQPFIERSTDLLPHVRIHCINVIPEPNCLI
jgi:hypothetical protein